MSMEGFAILDCGMMIAEKAEGGLEYGGFGYVGFEVWIQACENLKFKGSLASFARLLLKSSIICTYVSTSTAMFWLAVLIRRPRPRRQSGHGRYDCIPAHPRHYCRFGAQHPRLSPSQFVLLPQRPSCEPSQQRMRVKYIAEALFWAVYWSLMFIPSDPQANICLHWSVERGASRRFAGSGCKDGLRQEVLGVFP